MAFKFTMRVGERDVEFEAHRKFIEAIASELFDQSSNEEARLVCIFANHISTAQRGRKDTYQGTDPEDAIRWD